jgi:hypothetical protein
MITIDNKFNIDDEIYFREYYPSEHKYIVTKGVIKGIDMLMNYSGKIRCRYWVSTTNGSMLYIEQENMSFREKEIQDFIDKLIARNDKEGE